MPPYRPVLYLEEQKKSLFYFFQNFTPRENFFEFYLFIYFLATEHSHMFFTLFLNKVSIGDKDNSKYGKFEEYSFIKNF